MKVPVSDEVLPGEERIRGEHIASWAKMLQEASPELYNRLFSQYISRGFDPVQLPTHFEEVLNKILGEYGLSISGGGSE